MKERMKAIKQQLIGTLPCPHATYSLIHSCPYTSDQDCPRGKTTAGRSDLREHPNRGTLPPRGKAGESRAGEPGGAALEPLFPTVVNEQRQPEAQYRQTRFKGTELRKHPN